MCQDPQETKQIRDLMEKSDGWLGDTKTAPELGTIIKLALINWKEGLGYQPTETESIGAEEAFEAQECIRRQAFLEGCISMKWRELQSQYYQWIESYRWGGPWALALKQKLWDVAWD